MKKVAVSEKHFFYPQLTSTDSCVSNDLNKSKLIRCCFLSLITNELYAISLYKLAKQEGFPDDYLEKIKKMTKTKPNKK